MKNFFKGLGKGLGCLLVGPLLLFILGAVGSGEVPANVAWTIAGVIATVVIARRWWGMRDEPWNIAASATTHAYVGVMLYAFYLIQGYDNDAGAWRIVALAFTVACVIRALLQEFYIATLAGLKITLFGKGKVAHVSELDIVRVQAPLVFRWAHRAFSVAWVWVLADIITDNKDFGSNDMVATYAIAIVGFGSILFGPFAFPVQILSGPFALLYFSYLPTIPWALTSLVWGIQLILRTPSDARFNHTRAWRQTQTPWIVMA